VAYCRSDAHRHGYRHANCSRHAIGIALDEPLGIPVDEPLGFGIALDEPLGFGIALDEPLGFDTRIDTRIDEPVALS
jgi:hypothetical protein